MAKAKSDENDETKQDRDSEECKATETDKKSDSDVDLKPVRPKIGESKDNLRQRSEWFQKRRS